MKSLLKRITGDPAPAEGDATGFPQAVANSVHSLLQRLTGPAMRPGDEVCCLTFVLSLARHGHAASREKLDETHTDIC